MKSTLGSRLHLLLESSIKEPPIKKAGSTQFAQQVKDLYSSGQLTPEKRSAFSESRNQLLQEAKTPHYDVVVSGAGPAGLVAAIELAEQGNNVCVCEARDSEMWDIRSSVLTIRKSTMEHLSKALELLEERLGSDHVFSHNQKKSDTHHKSLGVIRKTLEENLKSDYSTTIIQTDVLQRIYMALAKEVYPDQITIMHQASAKNFDPWLQTIELNNTDQPIAFDSIIHADGVRGATRRALGTELGVKTEYVEYETQYRGKAQCAYLQCPEWKKIPMGVVDSNTIFTDQTALSKLQDMGWDHDFYPETYVLKPHIESDKLWVSGQCPENLEPEKQLEWNRLVCSLAMPRNQRTSLESLDYIQPNSDSERKSKKNLLGHSIFDIEKKKLQNPTVDLPFGNSISIGDAKETPNFFLYEGIENALTDAKSIKLQKNQ